MESATTLWFLLVGSLCVWVWIEGERYPGDGVVAGESFPSVRTRTRTTEMIISTQQSNYYGDKFTDDDKSVIEQLASQTLDFLLENSATVTFNTSTTNSNPQGQLVNISFAAPCSTAESSVLESTESLLVATAVAKGTENQTSGWEAFDFFDSVFVTTKASSSILPKYSYPVEMDSSTGNVSSGYFIDNTKIPNWPMFYQIPAASEYCDPNNETTSSLCWLDSNRVSAIPFHATFLLELISQLESKRGDTQESFPHEQVEKIQDYWNRIYRYHQHLHEVVMRGCRFPESGDTNDDDDDSSNKDSTGKDDNDSVPCYNILHPWESLTDLDSPLWQMALQPTMDKVKSEHWERGWDLPAQVTESYDYNEEVYNAMLYLLECQADVTQNSTDEMGDIIVEEEILKNCPFAMLDIGYAAALAQSNVALLHAGMWLSVETSVDFLSHSKLTNIQKWSEQSQKVLEHLWDEESQSYLSQHATELQVNRTFPEMIPSSVAVASNLMVFWMNWGSNFAFPDEGNDRPRPDDARLSEMASQLLQHSGKFSFDCGQNPLPSFGCDEAGHTAIVNPILNYFVGLGMKRTNNDALAFGNYVSNSTLSLICGEHQASMQCAINGTLFPAAFPVQNAPLPLDTCESSSIGTAAVLFHLLVGNVRFTYEKPIPPIRNSWVITLITVELSIAFFVGVSCVYLSLHLLRKENNQQTVPVGGDSEAYMTLSFDAEEPLLDSSDQRQLLRGTFSEASSIDTGAMESLN